MSAGVGVYCIQRREGVTGNILSNPILFKVCIINEREAGSLPLHEFLGEYWPHYSQGPLIEHGADQCAETYKKDSLNGKAFG